LEWWSMPWQQWRLPMDMRESMPVLELLSVLIALTLWGPSLSGRRVMVYSDAKAVVQALQRQSASAAHMIALGKAVRAVTEDCGIALRIAHIDGVRNKLADAASRLSVLFTQAQLSVMGLVPQLRRPIPRQPPDWLSSLLQPTAT